MNLSEIPFEMNLSENRITFGGPAPKPSSDKLRILSEPIFRLRFLPPDRDLVIEGFSPGIAKKAKAMGLKKGLRITELDYVPSGMYDRFEV